MKAVLQRVSSASVRVNDKAVGQIGRGLLALIGVAEGDDESDARWMAQKIAGLRIFPDGQGKMNLSVRDVGGGILAVSQFTLLADASRGKRPSFTGAAEPGRAKELYTKVLEILRAEGVLVETGVFQEHMKVELVNDGPVTIILESPGK